MELERINAALERIFDTENQRIVFWNDPDKEFVNQLPFILLDNVEMLRLDEASALETKIRLEVEDPKGRYLLYSPGEEPAFEEDWLLDIRLFSYPFRADRASMIVAELGLLHKRLREHIALRLKFFDSKERLQKLKHFVAPGDNEQDLDRKMLAVVTRAAQPDLASIVRTLFHSMTEEDELDFDVVPSAWVEVEKYGLEEAFWKMVSATFGYREESPHLRNLLVRMLVSDCARLLGKELPTSLQHHRLSRSGTANAVVCLDSWRDSSSQAESYNRLAREVGPMLHIGDELSGFELEDLLEVKTFLEADKAIIRGLLQRASTQELIDPEAFRAVASKRQSGYWVTSTSVPEADRRALAAVYEALAVAAEFLALRNQFQDGFDYADAEEMYRAYETALFRFDRLYRHFCFNADIVEARGWDMLKSTRTSIEAHYCNWYLLKLGLAWGKFVEGGLLDNWELPDLPNEYEFFKEHVKTHLDEAENRRAFVIVSDALRYEAAHELTRELNGTYRFQAELSSQLGVLPSYTALGMASLLPHKTLEYTDKGAVLADGKPTASIEQRSEILAAVGGTAIWGDGLIAMKKDAGRAFVEDKRVVYIYHNAIDAQGDQAATEAGTFDAVGKAIAELKALVSYVFNSLNGNYLVVTADHGFLFTETAPSETDKSKLSDKPPGAVTFNKRYLLGRGLPENDEVWHGTTAATAQAEGGMDFWIPRGANRFHFMGGARFIHGGAMPQEIVVPVVRVKHLKDKKARAKTKTKVVPVQVLGATHKITTHKHRFTLMQMESVSDRAKAVTIRVAVFEGDEAISSIETVTFDSVSDNLEERKKSVILTLQEREFDKNTPYRLVLRDADTGIDQQNVTVTIDRAITDDFDF